MTPSAAAGYAGTQKLLHWLMAILILVMVVVGLSLPRLDPGPLANTLYEVHKSTGIVVLALAVIRLAVRLIRGVPPLTDGLPVWQQRAARASHIALYALMFAIPVAGLTATSACCPPVRLFWTVPVTLPLAKDMAFAESVFWLHLGLGLALVAVVAVHVAAALHHHLVRRDDTLRRMLPGSSGATQTDGSHPFG